MARLAPPVAVDFLPAQRHFEEVLRGIRAGRATPQLVENIEVEAYGSRLPLQSLATINVVDPRTLSVEPWDQSQLKTVEKAIATSPLGVNPVTAGTAIRIPLPPLNEQRRQELTKLVRQHLEDARMSIRQVRERKLKELRAQKDAGELSEDAWDRARKALQEQVEAATAAVEKHGKEKEQEILTP